MSDVIVFGMVYYTVGNDYDVTGADIVNLIVYYVGAATLFEEIYLIKRMIMGPGASRFGYSLTHTAMKVKLLIGIKFDVAHTMHLLSFLIISPRIKKVKKSTSIRQFY